MTTTLNDAIRRGIIEPGMTAEEQRRQIQREMDWCTSHAIILRRRSRLDAAEAAKERAKQWGQLLETL